ncbi:hypothetical protein HPB52_021311 [Rhipicephalus sanguineus]|uniref:CCHC-type domain-containing protein n=1 Tax=Rhipicephalus sanguineus TaxID=34632 RepID=A0A9D4SPE3_RHISA|nr:hypothetical protein HPB52_021311 [Rhipicephalus sanguineus]
MSLKVKTCPEHDRPTLAVIANVRVVSHRIKKAAGRVGAQEVPRFAPNGMENGSSASNFNDLRRDLRMPDRMLTKRALAGTCQQREEQTLCQIRLRTSASRHQGRLPRHMGPVLRQRSRPPGPATQPRAVTDPSSTEDTSGQQVGYPPSAILASYTRGRSGNKLTSSQPLHNQTSPYMKERLAKRVPPLLQQLRKRMHPLPRLPPLLPPSWPQAKLARLRATYHLVTPLLSQRCDQAPPRSCPNNSGHTIIFRPLGKKTHFLAVSSDNIASFLSVFPATRRVRVNYRRNLVAVDTHQASNPTSLLQVRSKLLTTNTCVGLVFGVDSRSDAEAISVNISSSVPVTSFVRRGKCLTITFEGTTVPKEIFLYKQRRLVRPRLPRPLQCTRCGRNGHATATCLLDECCLHCGGNHAAEPCTAEQPRSVTCNGNHASTDPRCSSWQLQRKAAVILASSDGSVTRRQALERAGNGVHNKQPGSVVTKGCSFRDALTGGSASATTEPTPSSTSAPAPLADPKDALLAALAAAIRAVLPFVPDDSHVRALCAEGNSPTGAIIEDYALNLSLAHKRRKGTGHVDRPDGARSSSGEDALTWSVVNVREANICRRDPVERQRPRDLATTRLRPRRPADAEEPAASRLALLKQDPQRCHDAKSRPVA